MITLKNIIQTEFENVTEDEVVNQLSEHKLYGVIIQTIELVNAHLANKEQQLKSYGTIQVSHIASSVLIRVNEYLKLLDNRQKDVWELKQLVGSIFKRLLMMISAALPKQAKQKFAISLEISLKETCLIHGYKFKELVKFLGLDTLAYVNWIAATDDSIVPTAEQRELIPGYVWKNGEYKKREGFIQLVADLNICSEPERFNLLFEDPNDNLAIQLNIHNPNFILQFLACVKNAKCISSYGGGFYQVLQCHVVNFDSLFLRDAGVQRGVDRVKALVTWQRTQSKVEEHLKALV